ncbi:MAG: TlyA family RNA methyltransferase [Clostridia bacterium]|nr:TlyA family RNA methyltransferase [Clostridia bacterium]
MKKRLDDMMIARGIAPDKAKALALVMSGEIFVNGQRADKVGTMYKDDVIIDIREKGIPYVSRGGFKLEKAIEVFGIDLSNVDALDIGSSTGGFTDCMLQKGARHVWDVDVGKELAWKLRNDPRITLLERTNIRNCTYETFGTYFDFVSADVSFISLRLVLPVIYEVLKPNGVAVCLVKPQFEAEKDEVGKGGIITDSEIHVKVLKTFVDEAEKYFKVTKLTYSPITGAKGNIEFLAMLTREGDSVSIDEIHKVVNIAHEDLIK